MLSYSVIVDSKLLSKNT